MSALKEELQLTKDIKLVYDLSEKPNHTQLKAHKDRAVISKIKADLVLPTDKIMTVEIDFDTDSDYHNNSIMVMDEFGAEMIETAFEVKYGKVHADKIRQAWQEKQDPADPRKPTYLLIQKPQNGKVPKPLPACGKKDHPPKCSSRA